MKGAALTLAGLVMGLAVVLTGCEGRDPAVGELVFTSNKDGDNEIYVIRADGSGLRQLTKNQRDDIEPVWSPDGKRVAFTSNRDGNRDIFVISADGSGLLNLTKHPGEDMGPSWSPDGSRIAFKSFRDGVPEIYAMGADGSDPTNLTRNGAQDDTNPQWSPDGTRLAFETFPVTERGDIVVANADGSGQVNLTNNGDIRDNLPRWSKDGTTVAFISERNRYVNIYSVPVGGGDARRVTDGPGIDTFPVWTPDDSIIVFTSTRDSARMDVYTVDVRTGAIKNLTARPDDEDYDHSLSPDGTRVAFVRTTGSRSEISIMNIDGTGQKAVTSLGAQVHRPLWRPTAEPARR